MSPEEIQPTETLKVHLDPESSSPTSVTTVGLQWTPISFYRVPMGLDFTLNF